LFFGPYEDIDNYIDSEGNFVYFFKTDRTKSSYAGRYNVNEGSWEILGFNGWESADDLIGKPIGGSSHFIVDINAFEKTGESGKIRAVFSSLLKSGIILFDVHGNIFEALIDGNKVSYWSNPGMSEYNSQGLFITTTQTQLGYRSDFDSNEETGIVIGEYRESGKIPDTEFIASRYYIASGEWENWFEGNWVVFEKDRFDILPLFQNPTTEDGHYPSINELNGDFILTYFYKDSSGVGVRAGRYNVQAELWEVWNGGWTLNTATQKEIVENSPEKKEEDYRRRPTIVVGNELFMFYEDSGKIRVAKYDSTTEIWKDYDVAEGTKPYPAVDSAGVLWVFYQNGNNIERKKFQNDGWVDEKLIYPGTGEEIVGANFVSEDVGIILIIEEKNGEKRLKAIGDNTKNFWDGKEIRNPVFNPEVNGLGGNGVENRQWDTNVYINENTPVAYGSEPCGDMEIDAEGYVYCPAIAVSNIRIFPGGYQNPGNPKEEKAHAWGNEFDSTGFSFPSSVAVYDAGERVYVLDDIIRARTGSMTSSPGAILRIYDRSNRDKNIGADEFLAKKTTQITGEELNSPRGLAVDEKNKFLYIVDSSNNRVIKTNLSQNPDNPQFLGYIGSEGSGNGEFSFPQGIDVDSEGNIYVVDTNNHRIQKFDSEGNHKLSFGSLGRKGEEFVYPYAISVDKVPVENKVYITDPYNKRIQVFDTDGNFIFSFGSWDSPSGGLNNFDYISGIVADNDKVYVSVSDGRISFKIVAFDMKFGNP